MSISQKSGCLVLKTDKADRAVPCQNWLTSVQTEKFHVKSPNFGPYLGQDRASLYTVCLDRHYGFCQRHDPFDLDPRIREQLSHLSNSKEVKIRDRTFYPNAVA
jgi:hypothetical protein